MGSSDDEESASSLTDAHRFFLQGIMAGGTLSEKDVEELFSAAKETYKYRQTTPLTDFVETINKALSFLYMQIRNIASELDGEKFYGLINTRADLESQKGTQLTLTEIGMFRKIMNAVIEASDPAKSKERDGIRVSEGSISVSAALEHGGNAHSLNERTLERLVQERWLVYTTPAHKRITLGVRSLMELKQWLEENYEDHVSNCLTCHEPIFMGEICQNNRCEVKLHHHCSKRWFTGNRERVCPSCKNVWKMR
ncbi:hypothetical protein PROFUN_02431 [Planoprotostelium fungivorum]|uniref:Non-structural maintenance of chromosomes element 1 homolog n=1 Tax=Planoprotostelium fungivorum TaxID=1890364 RepID=A0A2P6NUU2_9EUKA|nr:hypothetical protein PROFUN_02431 [Planoprotostelium fungivorum]